MADITLRQSDMFVRRIACGFGPLLNIWIAQLVECSPETPPITIVLAEMADALIAADPDEAQLALVYERIEEVLGVGESWQKDAVATGFVEALVTAVDNDVTKSNFIQKLGPLARHYTSAWNEFCGVEHARSSPEAAQSAQCTIEFLSNSGRAKMSVVWAPDEESAKFTIDLDPHAVSPLGHWITVDGLRLSRDELTELAEAFGAWLTSRELFVLALGDSARQWGLELSLPGDIICSVEKPVFTIWYSTPFCDTSARQILDETVIRSALDDLNRVLASQWAM